MFAGTSAEESDETKIKNVSLTLWGIARQISGKLSEIYY